jgi:CRP-like cAMP-binding protein
MSHTYDASVALSAFLNRQPALSAEEARGFALLWTKQQRLRRGDFLCALGKTEQHVWFINAGVLRLFYPTDADEICVGFAYTDTLVCAFPSFLAQKPSAFSVQALSDCRVCGISRSDLHKAREKWPGVARFWTESVEYALAGIIEREIEVHTSTPEQRYARLLERSPHIFQLAPLKYIASYLRIAPETLSRLRSKRV